MEESQRSVLRRPQAPLQIDEERLWRLRREKDKRARSRGVDRYRILQEEAEIEVGRITSEVDLLH
uniref:IBB domain-containing protein n=1 Tax=Heterorhabditis bacteriophora TaxID=37862 RepID=A0A1I7WYX2_HETBA